MQTQSVFFNGHIIEGKTVFHHGGPFDTKEDAKKFRAWTCATAPAFMKPVTIRIDYKKNADGQIEVQKETVLDV
jgi:hypothetical protein